MQNTEAVKNTNKVEEEKRHLPGRPYYDNGNQTGFCPTCAKVWQLEEQIMYTTVNKTRTYGICPRCLSKIPLRKKPRTRDGFLARFPPKRIE